MPEKMRTVDSFAQRLCEHGVKWVSTLCGHGLNPLYDALDKAHIRLVDTRNEQTASYIADAFARLTRQLGVCAVSSGIAHVNALSGLANAWFDRAPVLLISGAGATRTRGLGHFQDIDQVSLANPITKCARWVFAPERAIQMLDELVHAALSFPPGPVHLTFPLDIQVADVDPRSALNPPIARPAEAPVSSNLDEIASELARVERPVIVAGSGCYYAGEAEPLLQFAEAYSIPVLQPIWDRGCVDRESPVFMGVVGAATGGPDILSRADCIIMAGAEPDYRVGYLQPPAVNPEASVHYITRGWLVLGEEMKRHGATPFNHWTDHCHRLVESHRQAIRARARSEMSGYKLHSLHVIEVLESVLQPDDVLLIDGGSIGQWAHQLLTTRYPGHWLTCGRSGVVGWGIGGAMAARLAYPDRRVILLSGDGAFTFNTTDLEPAARHGLHFCAIVADDCAWGITLHGQQAELGRPIASRLGQVDFSKLAESLGARPYYADAPDRLEEVLKDALVQDTVSVIHAPIPGGNPMA